jgi:large subunit ribosomal protein L23
MSWFDRFTKKKDQGRMGATKSAAVRKVAQPKDAVKPVADATVALSPAVVTGAVGEAYRILAHPLVSEKAVHAEARGTYTFVVKPAINKSMVKQAVKQVYGVWPKSVRVVNVEGKRLRFGRSFGKRQDWKKAIVTLPKGKTISIHEGV